MSVPSVPAFDPRSLRSLQNLAKQGDSPEALRAAARKRKKKNEDIQP